MYDTHMAYCRDCGAETRAPTPHTCPKKVVPSAEALAFQRLNDSAILNASIADAIASTNWSDALAAIECISKVRAGLSGLEDAALLHASETRELMQSENDVLERASQTLATFENALYGALASCAWFKPPRDLVQMQASDPRASRDSVSKILQKIAIGFDAINQPGLRKKPWIRRKAKSSEVLRLARWLLQLQAELRTVVPAAQQSLLSEMEKREETCQSLNDGLTVTLDTADAAVRHALDEVSKAVPFTWSNWSSPGWETHVPTYVQDICTAVVAIAPEVGTPAKTFGSSLHMFSSWNPLANTIISLRTERAAALTAVENAILKTIASRPLGDVEFMIYDPIGLGASVASLLDIQRFTEDVVGPKVWTTEADLERRLFEVTNAVEERIQKDLRSEFRDIYEYNANADAPRSSKILVLFDLGVDVSRQTVSGIQKILESGPRTGIFIWFVGDSKVLNDPKHPLHGMETSQYEQRVVEEIRSKYADIAIDVFPKFISGDDRDQIRRFVESLRISWSTRRKAVLDLPALFGTFSDEIDAGVRNEIQLPQIPVDPALPETWWTASSVKGIGTPVGRRRKDETTIVRFDSDHVGALLIGETGSGKSILLHDIILGLGMLYSPAELEFYLIDFKQGVEFKVYADEALPHARCVALETEREFGLSVLETVLAEAKKRSEIFKNASAVTNIETYRVEANEPLPRILLVFDEFQELFRQNDALGRRAADALEVLVRQGRSVGIHVILSSQSLSGIDGLSTALLDQLRTRILLRTSPRDASRVLGDDNVIQKSLTEPGECIINDRDRQNRAFNQLTQVAFSASADHRRLASLLRTKAQANNFQRGMKVFEGNALQSIGDMDPQSFVSACRGKSNSGTIGLIQGAPMLMSGSQEVRLRRDTGANVLACIKGPTEDDGPNSANLATPLFVNTVLSAVASGAKVSILDFTKEVFQVENSLRAVVLQSNAVTYMSGRTARIGLEAFLQSLMDDIQQREAEEIDATSRHLVVILGLPPEFEYETLEYSATTRLLEEVLAQGPEVGVHCWVWTDSAQQCQRRLSPAAMRQFDFRIIGRCSESDSYLLLGNESALSLRENQLLIGSRDDGNFERCIGYTRPQDSWTTEVVKLVNQFNEREPNE